MADLSKLKLPDNSEYNLKDEVARSGMVWYGTCNTLANTTEKAVTISGITSLSEGLNIRVKMLNEAAAASPTLNLNSLGAKAITRSAKPSLPSGYSRVLGFSMNDNTYFEIDNFKLTGADTVRFSFSMTANCNVFGCYTNSSATNNYSLFVSTSSTASYLRYNGGTYNSYIPAANRDQQLDVVITPHGVTGMPTNSSWTAKTFTASSDMCIGTSSPEASSASLIGNLYGAFIVEGRFNGIPCERLSDNVLGYYDTYSKTFYEPAVGTPTSLGYDQNDYFDNAGTGEWAAGEVLDLVYDGTSWIIVDGAIADEETYGYTKLSDSVSSTSTNVAATANAVKTAYDLANGKQDALVSGTNIKTINNESVLGSGNLTISAEPEIFWATYGTTTNSEISAAEAAGKICAVNVTIQDGPMSFPVNCILVSHAYNTATFQCVYNSDIVEAVCAMDSWSVGTQAVSLTNHTHGNITSAGDITATAPTIASGDKLIINDESASKVTNGPAFGTSTTTFLRNDGAWAEPASGDSLPDQTGNTGKFLTTDGTDASWANLPSIPSPADANPLMDGTAAKGTSTDYAREDHVHPTDTSRAPTSHASSATTYGIGTDTNYGHVKLSASTSSTSGTSGGIAATPSAVKSAYDLANGKYSKPSTGIPATDLAGAVQTSLGKADTALQSESDPVFTASAAYDISSSDISNWNSKQAALVSGTNIKTINNESLLGSGNITIQGGGSSLPSQTGHTGDILATDGTDPYWADTSEVTTLNIDTTVTASSSNLITSGAVSTALGAKANTSHDHGNITSAGDITASSPTIASGDKLIINDESASKITNGPAFGTSTTTFLRNDGTWATPASGDSLPSQSGNSGKYLKTNGSTASWASVDALPSQSGHSGDYLTTNGSSASWADAVTTSTLSIDSAPTASSNNLVKSGGVYAAINTKVNRTSAVNEANTQYTTLMARGEKMIIKTSYDTVSDWSTELVNGAIAWCYE